MPTPTGTSRIGPYAIEAELGRGGMGVVYRARHVALDRPVAIKLLLGGVGSDPLHRERFRLEAQAAARIRHPNLVALYEVGEEQGCPYLVMDLVVGGSLQDLLDREGPRAPRDAAALAEKVARAVDAAHEALILHRDVKPANVLLDSKGEPLLTDFGLAKRLESAEAGPTRTGQLMGTPGYAPPEQCGGAALDVRADVYGVGALLYALLTGRPPFDGDTAIEVLSKVAGEEPKAPSRLRPELLAEHDLETICLRSLQKRPEDRYPTARALADDLARYLAHLSISARRPSLAERASRWSRRNRSLSLVLASAGALLLATALGAAAWAAREREGAREEARELARRSFEELSASLASVGSQDVSSQASGQGTTAALELLEAAQRWHAQAPDDPRAARAHFDAALGLGELARRSDQWTLARHGLARAARLGVDDARARALLDELEVARTAEAQRRRTEVEGWLQRAASGELAGRPDGLQDAVFAVVRYPEPQTVEVLARALEGVADELLAAETAWLRDRGAATPDLEAALAARRATPPGAALPEAARLALGRAAGVATVETDRSPMAGVVALAAAQRDRVGQGRLDLARVAAEALGRLSGGERARRALGAYLRVEADPLRAVPAGLALARQPEPEAQELVRWSLHGFGLDGPYSEQLLRALGTARRPVAGRDPVTGAEWAARALTRCMEGDAGGAIADATRALKLDPRSSDAWNALGIALARKGDGAASIEAFTRLIELDPTSSASWGNRSDTRRAFGDLPGALADAERAVELTPGKPEALAVRAAARLALGDRDGAIADYTRMIEVDPRRDGGFRGRGLARRAKGDLPGAIDDDTRALELDPRNAKTWGDRGLARSERGDRTGALVDYARSLELDPRDPTMWLNRGITRDAVGDHEGAIEDYTRALELAPRLVTAWLYRGCVRVDLKDFAAAIPDLDRVIELEPGLANGWLMRGSARAQAKLPGARTDFERFLELAPEDPNAPQVRKAVEELRGDPR